MARKLQTFRHSETTYNRPNQNWSCGRECEGVSCALGPDTRGRCRAGFVIEGEHPRTSGECIPSRGEYNKFTGETTNSDRWFCTREAAHRGPCKDGPRPDGSCCRPVAVCRPESSLRLKRGTFTVFVAGLSVATILIFFARKPDALNHPLNPGPISATHSTAGITCADCHSDPSVSLAALSDFHSTAFDDGLLCLKCHGEIGKPGDGKVFAAHTLPAGHLDLLSQKAKSIRSGGLTPVSLKLADTVAKNHDRIACATCHQEHHGKNADLKALGNNQCQVCHTGRFRGFTSGHPEFTSYPYRRKTRIFFDHDTHFRTYFISEAVKDYAINSCSQCHMEDADGGMMATGRYEKTCAACHDKDTRFGDWEILAFPKVDTSNLANYLSRTDSEKLQADWGSATSKEVSPLIQVLLDVDAGEGSKKLTDAFNTLREPEAPGGPKPVKLSPLRGKSQKERIAGATIASAVLNEIYGDDAAFEARLLQSRWLDGASREDRKRLGENLAEVFKQLRAPSGATDGVASSTSDFGGVFSYDRPSGSLTYESGGHADPFLKAALDVTAAKVSKIKAADDLFKAVSEYFNGFESAAAGKCLKCHTVDRRYDGTMAVNWYPAGLTGGSRPMTRFKHRSHVRLPELVRGEPSTKDESCATCHFLGHSDEWVNGYRAVYQGGNPRPNLHPDNFRGGFENLTLGACASCHTPTRAGDSCLLCHQYHAALSLPEPTMIPLPAPVSAPETTTTLSEGDPGGGQGEGGSPIPEDDGDSGDGTSLLLDGDGEGASLVPDEGEPGGEPLIPTGAEPEGESLVPDESGGESLLKDGEETEEDGESLIPDGNAGGESLLPEDQDAK